MVKKGSKKSKNKKKRESEELKEEISEVDKEYFQAIINDLTGQVGKLTERCQELETSNEDIQERYRKLDEDRADIIAYLKRQLESKAGEISELQERLQGLKQLRAAESAQFEHRISDLQQSYRVMEEQLSSEIKLLNGKLNSLEEFRIQRDDLNAKFLRQEQEMKDRDKDHQHQLHEAERKFILSKDRLKKEMEKQLLKMSTEYQAATTTRMAATTQRAVRENVALAAEAERLRTQWTDLRKANCAQAQRIDRLQRILSMRKLRECASLQQGAIQIDVVDHQGTASCQQEEAQTQTEESWPEYEEMMRHQSVASAYLEYLGPALMEPEEVSAPEAPSEEETTEQGPSYTPGSLGFVPPKKRPTTD